MHLLFRIVRAAHANGTHHKLALDALLCLQGDESDKWQRVFLKNSELYLQGSKAPDKEFKDFKNHVLHIHEGFWGGAQEKVRNWYTHLVDALQERDFERAVYCAGIMSHYYTDPLMPFHTGQCEAENNIHRAVEWSIAKSYDALWADAERRLPAPDIVFEDRSDWVEEMVRDGAELSHQFYEKLIAHYDFHKGVVEPREGLDTHSQRFVAGLLKYAAVGQARLIERAIGEANASAPQVGLTIGTLLATLKIPIKWLTKKLTDIHERRLVERMYDELQATGKVDAHLPEDDRSIRDLHAIEVLGQSLEPDDEEEVTPQLAGARQLQEALREEFPYDDDDDDWGEDIADDRDGSNAQTSEIDLGAAEVDGIQREERVARLGKPKLSLESDVERASSIGRKTASKLKRIGIATVGDLLDSNAEQVADTLSLNWLSSETITRWQKEARLLSTVPRLRGRDVQLLVGAGYCGLDVLVDANPTDVYDDIARFIATPEGQRLLGSNPDPTRAEIETWLLTATEVALADAA